MSAILGLLPDGEVLIKALMNTLMGMGTVFVVLIFISLLISLFKFVPALERKLTNRSKGKKKADSPAEKRPAPKRPVLTPAELQEEEEELQGDELIAVIMAAIVASTGGAVSADQLRIRSVRKVKRR